MAMVPAEQRIRFQLKNYGGRDSQSTNASALIEPWLEAGWDNPFKGVSTLDPEMKGALVAL